MNTFRLEIVTPTNVFDEGEVTYLRCPGLDGLFGVMAQHTKSIFALAIGEIKVNRGDEVRYFATSGGYTEVTGAKVQLLVETAELAHDIDLERAESSAKRAQNRLAKKGEMDLARAEVSLKRALNRLRVVKR